MNETSSASPRRLPAFQDGGQFYDDRDGSLIADYGYLVSHDYDMQGAGRARAKFQAEHPQYDLDEEEV